MPPLLALLLCTAFVLFLLRLERRRSRGVSRWVWIPTFWLMLMGSRPLALWFGMASLASNNESGSALDRWMLTILAIMATVVLVHRHFDWWASLRQHKWLVALFAYMFASALWSDFTLIALRRSMHDFVFVI